MPRDQAPNVEMEKAFLASYSLSNRLFPQTRCFFVLDFSSRIAAVGLARAMTLGIELPEDKLQKLAHLANHQHGERRVARIVDSVAIQSDVQKMLAALRIVFERYCEYLGESPESEPAQKSFVLDCSRMKRVVDALDLSPGYLDFIAPRMHQSPEAIVRSGNTYLAQHWPGAAANDPVPPLLHALLPEIDRPIWVLRPANTRAEVTRPGISG